MYFRIPADTNLSKTAYRAKMKKDDVLYIDARDGYIGEDWEKVEEEKMRDIAPDWFKSATPAPTQLDRIESTLALLTADTVTEESINTAILEGVNEV